MPHRLDAELLERLVQSLPALLLQHHDERVRVHLLRQGGGRASDGSKAGAMGGSACVQPVAGEMAALTSSSKTVMYLSKPRGESSAEAWANVPDGTVLADIFLPSATARAAPSPPLPPPPPPPPPPWLGTASLRAASCTIRSTSRLNSSLSLVFLAAAKGRGGCVRCGA